VKILEPSTSVLVSAGIELIFFPVAAVFYLYEKNVDNTDIFSCCCEIKDFLQSPIFKCAGAGREHTQAAGPSSPVELLNATELMLTI